MENVETLSSNIEFMKQCKKILIFPLKLRDAEGESAKECRNFISAIVRCFYLSATD